MCPYHLITFEVHKGERMSGGRSRDPSGLGQWLRLSGSTHPDRVAIESASECVSYAALSERVRSEALLWHNAGLRPGDRVGIAATRSVATVVAILTALETEVAYVPLDLAYPAERLQAMLVDAHLPAVVGDPNDLQ